MRQKDADILDRLVERNGLETIVAALERIARVDIHPALLSAALRIAAEDFSRDKTDQEYAEEARLAKQQARIDWLVREISQERAKTTEAEAERARLWEWLKRIGGGRNPCGDAKILRQWAYEALVLGSHCEVGERR